jgi:hypothetical protein
VLSEAQVIEIRDLYAAGVRKAELGRQFGTAQGTIKKIVERQSWQHVGGGGHEPGERVTQDASWGDGHSSFGGKWVDAEIKAFGIQSLLKVTLKRSGIEKVIHATAGHRWYVTPRSRVGFKHDHKVTTITQALVSGDRLAPLYPRTRLRLNTPTTPSPFGIAHGFVFGDGSLNGRAGSDVVLWGEKDKALLPYFAASRSVPANNQRGTTGIKVKDLPAFFKDFPSRSESLSYLYGWLAGYFAADGTVGKTGFISLACADKEILEWVRDLATQLGIGTHGINRVSRVGIGQTEPSDLWNLGFVASTLTADFFVIPEHRARFEARSDHQESVGWTVISVKETDRVEEVYCAVVPEHENFTLAGNINVMNCKMCFTVQVQPRYPAFPQTINGVPMEVPGMGPTWPGQDDDQTMQAQDAAEGMPVDPDAEEDPDAAEDPQAPDAAPDDTTPEDSGNPFAKKSFRSANGTQLTEDQLLRHIALETAHDRARMARTLRQKNGVR